MSGTPNVVITGTPTALTLKPASGSVVRLTQREPATPVGRAAAAPTPLQPRQPEQQQASVANSWRPFFRQSKNRIPVSHNIIPLSYRAWLLSWSNRPVLPTPGYHFSASLKTGFLYLINFLLYLSPACMSCLATCRGSSLLPVNLIRSCYPAAGPPYCLHCCGSGSRIQDPVPFWHFQNKIIFNFVKFVATKKRSGIRDGLKVRIRDPG